MDPQLQIAVSILVKYLEGRRVDHLHVVVCADIADGVGWSVPERHACDVYDRIG